MTTLEIKSFINILNNCNDLDYLFSIIMYSAAPTLARIKPSSLLNFGSIHNLKNTWEKYKEYIRNILNIDFFELKKEQKNIIVLFYNTQNLQKVLSQKRNTNFLKAFGYNKGMNIKQYLMHLSARFEHTCPHEIGIFLGYPVDDVNSFMSHPNKKCKMVGYWKVYHNVGKAKVIFSKYDKIKYSIIKKMIDGFEPLEIFKSL